MRVIHYTSECEQDIDVFRRLSEIKGVLFHRTGGGDSAIEIAKKFREDPEYYKWTRSKKMPYTFIIRTDGQVEQALRLTIRSPHAKMYSTERVSVGVVGDFRKTKPTRQQEESIQWLGRLLAQAFLPSLYVAGHTDLPGASNDPNKQCPGDQFGIADLRGRMLKTMQREARFALEKAGVIFGDE